MWKPKSRENHGILFIICLEKLHSLEAPTSFDFQLQLEGGSNPLFSQVATRGKLQLPNSLATTRRRLQPPMFSSYNWKVATTTCPCPILPPWSRSRMMEPLSNFHCEIYHCKTVPTSQQYIINKSSPQGTQRTQDVCKNFLFIMDFNLRFFDNN